MKRKLLPVHANPGLSTECYHNYRLSIVLAEPDGPCWAYSHLVNLTVGIAEPGAFPMIRFEEHLDMYADVLAEEPLLRGTGWPDGIRAAVDQGCYVIAYVNWRHIPGSAYFGITDLIHETLVYGYDDDETVFHVLAFDMDGALYGPARIAYSVLGDELDRVTASSLQTHMWFAYYGFPAIRVRHRPPGRLAVDERSVFFALDRNHIRASAGQDETYVIGCGINDYLAAWFRRRSEGEAVLRKHYSIWNILIYKMIQHKRWMLKRLELLAGGDGGADARIRGYYEKGHTALLRIRALSLKYQQANHPEHLLSISEEFQKIYELEKRAVPQLKTHLVQRRTGMYT